MAAKKKKKLEREDKLKAQLNSVIIVICSFSVMS